MAVPEPASTGQLHGGISIREKVFNQSVKSILPEGESISVY